MKLVSTHMLFCFCCLSLAGCNNFSAPPYGLSMDNVRVLKRLAPANVTVGTFGALTQPSLVCRAVNPIRLPGDETPEVYMQKALADEIELAGLSTGRGPDVTLTGQIDTFEFSSLIGDASWHFALTMISSNGARLSVESEYPFHTSFAGDVGCQNVADAFEPAVQALDMKLVSDPGFPALLRQ